MIRTRLHLFRCLLTVLLIPLLVHCASAQVSRTTAAVDILVTDQTGAIIPGATIEAADVETSFRRTTVSDSTGHALITGLAPGAYQIQIKAPAFNLSRISVTLLLGTLVRITAPLTPASVTQQVNVSAESNSIDTRQTTIATNIDIERIEESPVVTRNYLDFVLLAPGLATSNLSSFSTGTTVQPDSGFAFAGQRPRSNSLYIDGVENNDEFTGANRTELSLELVHEFQVVHNGLSAELGGGAGGSINVITRSGANTVHGDAFVFLQNGALNAHEPFENDSANSQLHKERAGLALGGPIVKSKLFYYLAAEQERATGTAGSAVIPAGTQQINRLLASGAFAALPTRHLNPDLAPTERAETEASGRIDYQIDSQNAFSSRYSFSNNREVGDAFNAGGLNDSTLRGSSFIADHSLTAALTSTFGTAAVNDARVEISSRRAVLRSNAQTGPEIDIVGLVRFGRPYEGNSKRRENHYELNDGFSRSVGHHLLRTGVDVIGIMESLQDFNGTGGLYTFLSLGDFLTGSGYQFRQAFTNPQLEFGATKISGFVQDHWTVSRKFTLDFGLRYEFEKLPSAFHQDADNLAPRLGAAFSPAPNWVVRSGFGVFYDRYPLVFLARGLVRDGIRGFEQIFDQGQATFLFRGLQGGALTRPDTGTKPTVYRPQPNLPASYSEQANFGIEHEITKSTTISGTYLFSRGVHLSRTLNVNLLPPVPLTPANTASLGVPDPVPQQLGRPVFGPQHANSQLRDVLQLDNRAGSVYHGLLLGLNSRISTETELFANYTLSKCLDDASDYYQQPQNPFAARPDRALCDFDQRQRFVFSGLFELPFGDEEDNPGKPQGMLSRVLGQIEIAPILTLGSSRPLNAITGFDANLSHSYPISTRPLGIARNSLKTGEQIQIDLRVLKYFKIRERGKLDFVVEAFNLANHANVIARQSEFGPSLSPLSDFNRPIAASLSRQLQFSIDFEF